MPPTLKSVTLIELIIAIVLMGLIVLGFSSIDLFSRYHVISSDRRAKLQNEVSYVLEHMTKEIAKAIGDINNQAVFIEDGNQRIKVYIDADQDGQRNDYYIAYQYSGNPNYEMRYYSNYPGSYETIAKRISAFTFPSIYTTSNNYLEVKISACWDPDGSPIACGLPDNPSVTMQASIKMPGVSTN